MITNEIRLASANAEIKRVEGELLIENREGYRLIANIYLRFMKKKKIEIEKLLTEI